MARNKENRHIRLIHTAKGIWVPLIVQDLESAIQKRARELFGNIKAVMDDGMEEKKICTNVQVVANGQMDITPKAG